MFAGIVEGTGRIVERAPRGDGDDAVQRLVVAAPELLADVAPGASVAVDGVCLTLVAHGPRGAGFDVIRETLDVTTLGQRAPGAPVNLERSLRVGDRIDGHFVQGHVDGAGEVVAVQTGDDWRMWIAPPGPLRRYIVHKGSIAIDGVSLTVAAAEAGRFCVALIPTTLERTTLGGRRPGDRVNLETDILTRTVVDRFDLLMAARGCEAVAS